jgi:DNA phosphorothioation-dependent restriction protein DptH
MRSAPFESKTPALLPHHPPKLIHYRKKDAEGIIWRYQTLPERLKPSESHPVKAQYSDILMNLHTTLLEASTQLLDGARGSLPVLEVRLDEESRSLLEQLHQNSNWVITLDRFFALDYYDSPHIEGLDEMARKYVLDYSPEFSEGLGHRLMITTSWHEEIGSLLRQAMEEHGLAAIESSVSHLLHHLKIVSGSLALQALESRTSASAAVGLGLVTAWLQGKNRLRQSILIPVDLHPRLFIRDERQALQTGDRRCDLALFTLKRNIVDVTFIEVKWRRGRVSFERLGEDMYLQMHSSRRIFEERFFRAERIDGALQRSHLGNVLRFYFDRSRRYKLFDVDAEHTFLERIAELEKTSLELRWHYEGYIVSLDQRIAPFDVKEAKIRVLSASDFDTKMFPISTSFTSSQESLLSDDILLQEDNEPEDIRVDQDDLLSNVLQRRRTGTLALLEIASENDLSEVVMVTEDVTDEPAQHESQKKSGRETEVMVPLGTSSQGGECQWRPSVKGSPHLFIIGIPGQGKSWATTRLLIELSRQNVPALVLDFHSQFSNPDEVFARQVQPYVLDVARGLPFSPFECPPDSDESDVIANSLEVAEIFAHVTNLGPIQQDTLYRALQSAYQENGFGRARGSEKLEYPTLESVLGHIKNEGKGRNNVDLILAHCRSLLEMNLFRPEQSEINLLDQIRNGLVLDLHRVPEQLQRAAGAFILRKLYKDMFRWGSTDRLRLTIVLDEAHRLAKDVTLPKIMKEGRKFGVLVIVASQELTDFHQGIIGNVGTKIIFRVNHPDSRKVAGLLQASMGADLARQISQLPVGTAYVQTPEMPNTARIHMYPLN